MELTTGRNPRSMPPKHTAAVYARTITPATQYILLPVRRKKKPMYLSFYTKKNLEKIMAGKGGKGKAKTKAKTSAASKVRSTRGSVGYHSKSRVGWIGPPFRLQTCSTQSTCLPPWLLFFSLASPRFNSSVGWCSDLHFCL